MRVDGRHETGLSRLEQRNQRDSTTTFSALLGSILSLNPAAAARARGDDLADPTADGFHPGRVGLLGSLDRPFVDFGRRDGKRAARLCRLVVARGLKYEDRQFAAVGDPDLRDAEPSVDLDGRVGLVGPDDLDGQVGGRVDFGDRISSFPRTLASDARSNTFRPPPRPPFSICGGTSCVPRRCRECPTPRRPRSMNRPRRFLRCS